MSLMRANSLLTHVFAHRAARNTPATLRDKIQNDRFVVPCIVSPREFHDFDTHVYSHLPEVYELIELSPLAPLGTVSTLAAVDPGLVVSTARSHEVLSDCTNVLALLAATRRYQVPCNQREEVNLSASHRLVRAQYPRHAGHTAHFKILTLVSAGRDKGNFAFELHKLLEHIGFYVNLIRSFDFSTQAEIDIALREYEDTGVNWSDITESTQMQGNFTYQRISRENWNYYSPFQFQINIKRGEDILNIADGGMVDWTQKLLSDRKERLLISGFGTELFFKLFLSDQI